MKEIVQHVLKFANNFISLSHADHRIADRKSATLVHAGRQGPSIYGRHSSDHRGQNTLSQFGIILVQAMEPHVKHSNKNTIESCFFYY